MSTRCLIGIKKVNKYEYVYCHFDGYPEGVGETLVNSYDYEEIIEELISGGDMSSLGDSIKTTEYYEDSSRVSVCNIHNIPNVGQDFIYMWYGKKWHCRDVVDWKPNSFDWDKLIEIPLT